MPRFIIFIVNILIIIFIVSCNNPKDKSKSISESEKTETQENTDNENLDLDDKAMTMEEKIIDKVYKLPEIKERAEYIEKETDGERYLQIWIAARPKDTGGYYIVKAGEDNGFSMVTHFDFYVYPETMEIKYYDVITDSELSLAEWRKEK
ncbi:MAG: hypothetical protein PHH30_00395 [Bacteroidales bacterium]|nr:hypothetical protein [Bacteroidales bacterium]